MMSKNKLRYLIKELNRYRDAYYNENTSLISDKEYDMLYDELCNLESVTGIVYADSPTQSVGYEVKSELKKVKHSHPLLSLNKTTDENEFANYFGGRPAMLMAKLDGLTCSLTYRDGELALAESRGNGEIGEDITHNAMTFVNLPKKIPFSGEVIVDGECIIDYKTFDEINSRSDVPYKNPRNLVSGTVRQLDSSIAAKRKVRFVAWKLHSAASGNARSSMADYYSLGFRFLMSLGFEVVPHHIINDSAIFHAAIQDIREDCNEKFLPIDGMVGTFDDVEYGISLGSTSHHPKHSLAFKFYQEDNETVLRDIQWSTSRTGQINPVAIVDPVEIDGTTVSRASLSNVSIIKELELGIGDTVTIIKANQIIPSITNNLTRSNTYEIPTRCPDCGEPAVIKDDTGREVLCCTNDSCFARCLDRMVNFVGKSGMDIVGLSEERLKPWMKLGFVTDYASIYELENHRSELEFLAGFGKSSVDKILKAIEESRHRKFENVIVAIGIPGIGKSSAKTIAKFCESVTSDVDNVFDQLISYGMDSYDWSQLEDFGVNTSNSINKYIQDNFDELRALSTYLNIDRPIHNGADNIFGGKSFCITGKLEVFSNRNDLVAEIEKYGGKIVSGVTAKTNYLVTNDVNSGSSKNLKAKKYGTKIITERDFLNLVERRNK